MSPLGEYSVIVRVGWSPHEIVLDKRSRACQELIQGVAIRVDGPGERASGSPYRKVSDLKPTSQHVVQTRELRTPTERKAFDPELAIQGENHCRRIFADLLRENNHGILLRDCVIAHDKLQ